MEVVITFGRTLQQLKAGNGSQSEPKVQPVPNPASSSLRQITTWIFAPLIGSILRNRLLCALLLAAWLTQVGMVTQGVSGWPCPVHSLLQLPCPGCGLSRATVSLLQGHVKSAMQQHVLAPAALPAPLFLLLGAVRPKPLYGWFLRVWETLERRIPVVGIFLTALLLQWAFVLAAVPKTGLPG